MVKTTGRCPYCSREADLIFDQYRVEEYDKNVVRKLKKVDITSILYYDFKDLLDSYEDGIKDSALYYAKVFRCSSCGWWEVNIEHFDSAGPEGNFNEANYRGVLRAYNPDDIKIPIQVLRQELLRRGDVIYQIHDKKMEQLVASVLKDFYPGCEVSLCGKTGDGGIDLIILLSDTPMAVQVKRRTRPNSVERVEAVRAFLGASLLRGYEHLLYVTTADRFTGGPYGAQTEAEIALQRKLVKQFHLINRRRFFDMLHLVTNEDRKNWRKVLPPVFLDLQK